MCHWQGKKKFKIGFFGLNLLWLLKLRPKKNRTLFFSRTLWFFQSQLFWRVVCRLELMKSSNLLGVYFLIQQNQRVFVPSDFMGNWSYLSQLSRVIFCSSIKLWLNMIVKHLIRKQLLLLQRFSVTELVSCQMWTELFLFLFLRILRRIFC